MASRCGWCSGRSASRSASWRGWRWRRLRASRSIASAAIPGNIGALEASNAAVVAALGLGGRRRAGPGAPDPRATVGGRGAGCVSSRPGTASVIPGQTTIVEPLDRIIHVESPKQRPRAHGRPSVSSVGIQTRSPIGPARHRGDRPFAQPRDDAAVGDGLHRLRFDAHDLRGGFIHPNRSRELLGHPALALFGRAVGLGENAMRMAVAPS